MGNMNGSSEYNEERAFAVEEDEDKSSNEETEPDMQSLLDLSKLFNPDSLRAYVETVVKDVQENKLHGIRDSLLQWLEEKQSHELLTVNFSQFCEFLSVRGVSRMDSLQIFQCFDADDVGTADISFMIESLKKSGEGLSDRNLDIVVRTLQSCVFTPGLIDIYNEEKEGMKRHASKLLKYLLKNRVTGSGLMFSSLVGFSNTVQMRLSCVESNFNWLQKLSYKPEAIQSQDAAGKAEVQTVTKCIRDYSVSSSKDMAHRLFDTVDPFWQSDGTVRNHWIRLKIKKDVIIKQLSIGVSAGDQSYMPQHISISVGRSEADLRDIKDIRVPISGNGNVVLLENARTHYPVIQINIRRCHNDGCDCRIRGVKVTGYKVLMEPEVSLVDTMATWYIQILSSTTTACLPLSQSLRLNVLQHCRSSLYKMQPLCLSPASTERPSFISPQILKEIDSFLVSLSAVDADPKLKKEGLELLLSFHLAQGHLANVLSTLKQIHENKIQDLAVDSLLKNIDIVRDGFWRRQGAYLRMDLVETDGDKQNQASASDTSTNEGRGIAVTTNAATEEGAAQTNLIFKYSIPFQLTKIRVKVTKTSNCGMLLIYVLDDKQMSDGKLYPYKSQFVKCDNWKKADFDSYLQSRRSTNQEDNTSSLPIASYFFDEDREDIDMFPVEYTVGKYVLVKYIALKESCGENSLNIKFYGLERKSGLTEDIRHASCLSTERSRKLLSSTDVAVLKILSFLVSVVRDQNTKNAKSTSDLCRCSLINFSNANIALLWQTFQAFQESSSCQKLVFLLAHALLPYIVNVKNPVASDNGTEEFFQHVCLLVDNESAAGDCDQQIIMLAKDIITDGAGVFFSDKETRQKKFYYLMKDVTKTHTVTSVSLTFKSLCQFFGSDPSGLLELPTSSQQTLDVEAVIKVINTLLSVAYRDCIAFVEAVKQTDKSDHLVQLINFLQTKLLYWCQAQLTEGNQTWRKDVLKLIEDYVALLSRKSQAVLELFAEKKPDEMTLIMERLEATFLSTTIPQLVLLLCNLCNSVTSSVRVRILLSLFPVAKCLQTISTKLPLLFHSLDSTFWSPVKHEEKVLRTWEVESQHNYENSQDFVQVFSSPGATAFIVEFDPRCETERRYDYLEFTDSVGNKTRYDYKANTPNWPLNVTFNGGPRLQFHFHSDCSNNEWGYKFTVTAKGTSDVPMCWLFDLHISIAKLVGRLCGLTLDISRALPKSDADDAKGQAEQELLHSELWLTLFRGGYSTGKLQRSLSGKHESDEDFQTLALLSSIKEKHLEPVKTFLQKCEEHYVGNRSFGGPEVDESVLTTFAALIWHTQSLREDVSKYVKSNGSERLSDGIHQAFCAAEGLRHYLVEQRQQYRVGAEGCSSSERSEFVDPVPIASEKALFLTKFAGLSKVQLKHEVKSKMYRSNSRHYGRRLSTSNSSLIESVYERYPTFRLVMEFIKDPAWSTSRVDMMLKQRAGQALTVSEAYSHLTSYLQLYSNNDLFQIPNVVVLQELLQHQSQQPAQHYVGGLEGCGLENETRVRQSYYDLIRLLVSAIRSTTRSQLTKVVADCYDYIEACLLHLCDVNWQMYDLPFLRELEMPELYHSMVVGTVPMRERVTLPEDDEGEREEYKRFSKWLEEVKELGLNNWMEMYAKEPKKMTQRFIARYCDVVAAEIICDGCSNTLPGRRYRCLDCVDLDLCANCYAGGIVPSGEHQESHQIVHLQFKCDGCRAFIVGSRLHCNVCEDFDLCLSCQITSNYPLRHKADHDITKIPMVVSNLKKDSYSLLQSYCHQHAWLLFSSLTLSVAGSIYSKSSEISDADYASAATQLHKQSVQLLTKFFIPSTQPQATEAKTDHEENVSVQKLQEEAFLMHEQLRVMGLLGAMIPDMPEHNRIYPVEDLSKSFITEEFISMLFRLARGELAQDSTAQQLSLGLLSQLLQRVPPDYKIIAMPDISDSEVSGNESEGSMDESRNQPLRTLHFLFRFGAAYLEKSGQEYANSVASILQILSVTPAWRETFKSYITESLKQMQKSGPSLLSIFSLCVVAGFPDVLTTGTCVTYTDSGNEQKRGFVVKRLAEKNQAVVVDKKTRRHKLLSTSSLDIVHREICSVSDVHLARLLDIIRVLVSKQDSIENLWTLSLLLKALLKFIQSNKSVPEVLFEPSFVQCIISLASAGTGFSKLWLVTDLEVLSLTVYTRGGRKLVEKRSDARSKSSAAAAANCEDTEKGCKVNNLHGIYSLAGLEAPEKTLEAIKELHEVHDIPLEVLCHLYEKNHRSLEDLKTFITTIYSGTVWHDLDAAMNTSENEQNNEEEPAERIASKDEYSVDLGTKHLSVPSAKSNNVIPETCVWDQKSEEPSQQLMSTSGTDLRSLTKQRKIASTSLLEKELNNNSTEEAALLLVRVNRAMAILYSRQVLTVLLADWPELGHQITTDLLGCEAEAKLPYVLELLNQPESSDSFLKVVRSVVRHCQSDDLVSIARTSCSFMEEVDLISKTVESTHHPTLNGNSSVQEKIQIPGATYLNVQFDSRCCTEDEYDELVIAADAEFTQEKHTFSGPHDHWINFDMPGDTLYYKYSLDSESTEWGFRFTVLGGRLGRFDTGYLILCELLASKKFIRSLPLDELWTSLICVACSQTGQQRLKTIQLIITVLNSFLNSDDTDDIKTRVDLGLLKPLWRHYQEMKVTLEESSTSVFMPSVAHALTELFYVAESLAMKWNVIKVYQLSLLDDWDIKKMFEQGFELVAAVSLAAGLKNTATAYAEQKMLNIYKQSSEAVRSSRQQSPSSGGGRRQRNRRVRMNHRNRSGNQRSRLNT